jgi:N-acetylglucosaminylphosphatidylinositol deacetylase
VHLIRKYTFLGDLPLTSLSFSWRIFQALFSRASEVDESYDDKALIANTWSSYLKTRMAFSSHGSQYSWDRNLYMVLARQVWFNDLRRVPRRST